ncbi:MAG: elongation factor Ts [Candidatus Riflebacteria bacterium]|nr:elongation factor Ts [Candidatus Riflebacteria bacterium]
MMISAEMVRDLREKTGAGMMKCKEALTECKGNFEEAVDYLRKKGLASADKKSGRAVSEGLVFVQTTSDKRNAIILEINCETDFVARNDLFKNLSKDISNHLISHPEIKTIEQLEAAILSDGHKVEENRKNLIAKIGENVAIGRFERLSIPNGKYGTIDTYIHGDGKIGVVVQVECENQTVSSSNELSGFAHDVSLQAAAMKPYFVNRSEVPEATVNREKDVVLGQIKNDPKNANKPENILAKIVEGRIDKYYKENCLLEQLFVKDDTKTIQALSEDVGKKLGTKVTVTAFCRWTVGEQSASKNTTETTPEKACSCCA